ncbi:MAG: site-specific DNA-methyltransferase, partial [Flavobacteriales bacterium]|nr:site-specific DNA-methyltransferase [Flavobacteriales bacterium]
MSDGKKEILLGDCLELMKDIPNGSIDMILCDLPYGTTACKWDTIIPFEPLWGQYKRIIKDNGAIVLFGSQPFTSALVMSNPKMFKYEWIWEKSHSTGFALSKIQPLKYHENILVFGNGKLKYNPEMWLGNKNHFVAGSTVKSKKTDNFSQPLFKKYSEKNDGIKYPKSIQKVNCVNRAKSLHPTQKPVALIEYLIKTYTNEGDLVLDNCAGSGTT